MVWLIGNKGMLGSEIEVLLKEQNIPYVFSDKEVDITDKNQLEKFSKPYAIHYIINCSAYTAVDKAESEQERAYSINFEGVKNIALLAKALNAVMIHISTDYVFDGTKAEEYLETDLTCPIGIYGISKEKGEKAVQENLNEYFIIRTAWLYGQFGPNFVYTMLRLFKERDELKVVNDQWGSPTYAKDLAELIVNIVLKKSKDYGIYHFANEGKTNWYEFSKEIFKLAKQNQLIQKEIVIKPIPTKEYPTPAKRPLNSYLSKEKVKKIFKIQIDKWQDSLQRFLQLLKDKEGTQ